MAKLTREHVLKLAKLSRLKLTEEEIELFRKELSSILDYVEQLEDVDTTGLKPTYQVSGLTNVMREDEVKSQEASPQDLMDRVPRCQDGYIKVGRMI